VVVVRKRLGQKPERAHICAGRERNRDFEHSRTLQRSAGHLDFSALREALEHVARRRVSAIEASNNQTDVWSIPIID